MAEFEVNARVLHKALTTINSIVVTHTLSSEVHLSVRDGNLSVFGTDDIHEVGRCNISVESNDEFKFIVPAKIFISLMKRIGEEMVKVVYDRGSEKVELSTRGELYVLTGYRLEDFPERRDIGGAMLPVEIPVKILLEVLSKVRVCIGDLAYTAYSQGVYIEGVGGAVKFAATDGTRIASCRVALSDVVSSSFKFFVPVRTIKLLLASTFLQRDEDSLVMIRGDGVFIEFRCEDDVLMARLSENKFPKYEHLVSRVVGYSESAELPTEPVRGLIERLYDFKNDNSPVLDLSFEDGCLRMKAEDLEIGHSANGSVECGYDGDPVQVRFNASNLKVLFNSVRKFCKTVELFIPDKGLKRTYIFDTSSEKVASVQAVSSIIRK